MSGKRPQIHITVDPELLAAVTAEAAKNFDSVSGIAEARLRASYSTIAEPPKTALGSLKERSVEADLEMKQMRLAQLRKNLLTVDEALDVVEKAFGEMRVEGTTLMEDLARDFDLNADDLKRRFLECMAGPFAVRPETYQEKADEFSRQPFPS